LYVPVPQPRVHQTLRRARHQRARRRDRQLWAGVLRDRSRSDSHARADQRVPGRARLRAVLEQPGRDAAISPPGAAVGDLPAAALLGDAAVVRRAAQGNARRSRRVDARRQGELSRRRPDPDPCGGGDGGEFAPMIALIGAMAAVLATWAILGAAMVGVGLIWRA